MAKPFVSAMKEFFGLKEGQTLSNFMGEIKEMSYEVRMEFHGMLKDAGVDADPPIKPGAAV